MIIVGSGNRVSRSLSLGNAIAKSFTRKNATVEVVNLAELKLPVFDQDVEKADSYDDKTREFLKKSYEMDAFVWVTPIYHNSFSSLLKNALDWQHSKFPNKIVGMASHGGGRSPQAVDQLMVIARAQHFIAARTRVCTDGEDYDENFELAAENMLSRIDDMTSEISDLADKIS